MQHNRRQGRRAIAIAWGATLLGSCSYAYDVRAVAIDGRLAFVSSDRDYDCVANIKISSREARATPVRGDARGLVVNGGAFWWTDNSDTECTATYPVFYGVGSPGWRTLVAPKKLKLGVIYNIAAEGRGADGLGCFRMDPERRIENLSYARCLETPPSKSEV
jgi:hypothetical protein